MEWSLTEEAREFLREWDSGDGSVVAHTSGSTGVPKRVCLSKGDMESSARATVEFFNITSESRLYLPLSPRYIAGKMQIVRALVAGCGLTVEEPSSTPLAEVAEGEVTLVPIVPSQIEGLLASPNLGRIRNVIVGGAPMSAEQEGMLMESGVRAFATYGMTETCSHVALRRVGEVWFTALPGVEFGVDERGCLVVESSRLSFGRLVTNDVVELHSSHSFSWLGRADNVIISGGIKLHPEQIEGEIARFLPEGVSFYVTSAPSVRWGEEAVLVTDCQGVGEEVIARLREESGLPHSHLPKRVVRVAGIEYTANGKIKRRRF